MTLQPRTLMALAAALATAALALPAAAEEPHCHTPASATAETSRAATPQGFALTVPDTPVVDQDGRELSFARDLVDGKVVAMNFVFTTCTTVCPPMGAIFGRVQERLGERLGRDVHLVSVSIDPVTDTPERLSAWSRRFDAAPGWTLVTGDKREITDLLKTLGVFAPSFDEHSPLMLVGDGRSGRWTRASGLTHPDLVVEMLDGYLAATAAEEVAP